MRELRSHRWYGVHDLRSFGHRSRTFQMGYDREDFAGKPVIAVVNTWSDVNPCHTHLRAVLEDVKRGVWQAGGFPLEVPAISLSEPFQKPSTMLYRNLLALECEELLRSYPFDGAVLLGGCDKTTPALVMGAFLRTLPFIFVPCGPMLRAHWRGETLGSGVGRLEVLGRAARREHHAGRLGGGRAGDRVLARALHDDGDGVDDDVGGRGARRDHARRRFDPGRAFDHPRMAVAAGRQIVSLAVADADFASTSRTRSRSCWRWAARPTRSST